MSLADLSDLLTRGTGGSSGAPEHIWCFKSRRVGAAAAIAPVKGRYSSLWQYNGNLGQGSAPGAVTAPTNATAGSMYQTDPSGLTKYITAGSAIQLDDAGIIHNTTLFLYDRLLHIGGLVGNSASPQTVGGSLTRNTGGLGNQIWLEIYTAIGSTGTTVTASYTNQAGSAGQTTTAVAIGNTGNQEAQRIIVLPLASGDSGVQAVASVTLAASTLTAGNFGITIARPIAYFPLSSTAVLCQRNFAAGFPNLPTIDAGACLALIYRSGTAVNVPSYDLHLFTVCA